ncbi:hypothetical protein Q5P01_007257 [Channa striata]|uniref:Uncharacterized protein n=1 Tax=Channa striata TaxID=64152 RepID=A0AA88NBN2_CHASR|nr:hypothetical protein Q5P01_007257 [Channa striata]
MSDKANSEDAEPNHRITANHSSWDRVRRREREREAEEQPEQRAKENSCWITGPSGDQPVSFFFAKLLTTSHIEPARQGSHKWTFMAAAL